MMAKPTSEVTLDIDELIPPGGQPNVDMQTKHLVAGRRLRRVVSSWALGGDFRQVGSDRRESIFKPPALCYHRA